MSKDKDLVIGGLLKFFLNRSYMDDFVSGRLYCNTPHYFRKNDTPGISDRYEACISYSDGNPLHNDPEIVLDGEKIIIPDGGEVFTFLDEDYSDSWLHCWFVLSIPQSQEELYSLKKDLDRVTLEFGGNAVLLPSNNFLKYKKILQSSINHRVINGPVKYTREDLKRGMFKKRPEFSYQREYRYAFGEIDKSELKPLIINIQGEEFEKLIIKDPIIRMQVGSIKVASQTSNSAK